MTSRISDTPDRDKIRTLSKLLLSAFMLVAAALTFWGVLRAAAILSRNDNPRLVEAELRIQRGSILDRKSKVLAENSGTLQRQERSYPFPFVGPAIGYYSLIHGTAGVEGGFDGDLRGEPSAFWPVTVQQTLHLPQTGYDVQLALDVGLQETADALLGEQEGAVLLLEMPRDGADRAWVRLMASHPGYDPNLLDEQFDELGADERAPLLNRVTQGQYQPGLLLQPLILAKGVEQGLIRLNDAVEEVDRPVAINGTITHCASPPPDQATWADVLRHRCPGPMQALADQLGMGGLDEAFAAFGLDRDPLLEIDTTTTPDDRLADPLQAGIGQDNLSVTPLKMGLAMAALAGNGRWPQPQLAEALQDEEGNWQEWSLEADVTQATTEGTARAIRRALAQEDGIYEFNPLVISGPEGITNAWYVGMLAGETADYVVVVVLEGSDEETLARDVGRGVLTPVEKSN
jgi:peptidoglycan glycosyltransferase